MSNDPILAAAMQKKAERQANIISTRMRHIAKRVERELNEIMLPGEPKPVFGLFIFTGGAAQYVGNGQREDIKQVVASVLRRWDDPNYNSLHKPWHEKTDDEKAAEAKDAL